MKKLMLFAGISFALCQISYADSNAYYGNPTNAGSSAAYGNPSPTVSVTPSQDDGVKIKLPGSKNSLFFGNDGVRVERNRHHRHDHRPPMPEVRWLDVYPGYPIPPGAVTGGSENYQPLYVCHANYRGGVHPGKVVGTSCNISYAGQEIIMSQYQVLVSRYPLAWAAAQNGEIPPNAITGGFEDGHPLFICQVRYRGGMHPGKIVGRNCDIPYGGQEISVPYYNVLVQ